MLPHWLSSAQSPHTPRTIGALVFVTKILQRGVAKVFFAAQMLYATDQPRLRKGRRYHHPLLRYQPPLPAHLIIWESSAMSP